MKKIPAFLMVFLFALTSFAQKSASIKGIVADSLTKAKLEYATVAVVNAIDTSLVSYTVTKDDGTFSLTGLPASRHLKLIISYVGYQTYRQLLDLKPGAAINMGLIALSSKGLDEVVIQGERSPVSIKKDTIEFNAEAFKTRPNAVVEELLRLLPGVQVNNDGAIIVNGKATSKVLIDGKEFFGTNQLIAIRNLDADMIDKVQVYTDRENDPDHKINDMNLQNIVNLKLKSQVKKSTIGKFMGGIGTRERYEASGIMSSFRDTLQLSVMGAANNLNSTGFSQDDLYSMGGFNRSGTGQVDNGNFGGGRGGGLVDVKSGGLNINNNYGTALKLNLAYFYGNTVNDNDTRNLNEQQLESTLLTSLKTDNYWRRAATHSLGGLVEWKPDTVHTFRYRPTLTFSPQNNHYSGFTNLFNTQNPRLSESIAKINGLTSDDAFAHELWYYLKLKKGRTLTFNHTLALNSGGTDEYNYNDLNSFTDGLSSSTLDRYTNSGKTNNSAGFWVVYNLPLSKKLTAELFSNSRYLHSAEALFTYDKNEQTGAYDTYLPVQSNDFLRQGFFQNLKPLLNYQVSKGLRIRAALDLEFQYVLNKFNADVADMGKRYLMLFPSLSIDYNRFSISYSEWIDHPAIYNMQPVTRQMSPLYTFVGNPDLIPSKQHQTRANFYNYIPGKMLALNAFASLVLKDDNFVQKTTVDPNGASTSTVVNQDGAVSASIGGGLSKQFKKSRQLQISTGTSANLGYNSYTVFLNSDQGEQDSYFLYLSQNLNFNYKSAIILNSSYTFRKSLVSYTGLDYNPVSTYGHVLGASGMFRLPKRIIIDAKYNFMYNPQVAPGFPKSSHIVNLAVSVLTHKKDRGQLKLSVYDLLDQNISVNRYANVNAVITNEQSILRRYVMLNYQYKFSSFKNK